MKNKFNLFIVLAIALILITGCNNQEENLSIEQQIENAMLEVEMDFDEILHKEVVKDGIFVFYKKNDELWGGFIKLTNEGWEWVRGSGGASFNPEKGYNNQGSNYVESDFMIQYGIITDPSIENIKQEFGNRKAKKVTIDSGFRLWFLINKESRTAKVEPIYSAE
ncbi:hypothetical protein [Aquibacillus sediminis]|uniref:hypothetical protein n=1 Tax=Aquibacillus sediminis TaxID=2574734 RepID=UPI001107BC75|nr:hypothetical protein [Aquibacillus sediminis]